MNSAKLKVLYEKLPESIKVSFSPIIRRGMIKNKVFMEQYEELMKADALSEKERQEMQFAKLKELCIYVYENTTYYKKIFDEAGFDPYVFSSFEEFTDKVPILEKADVLENYDGINAAAITGDYPASTGGSSGTRLVVNNSKECFYKENAFLCHHYLKIGYDYQSSKVAYFGGMGDTLISASPLYNMMRYNSKLINAKTVGQVVKSLNSYRPQYIQGLPSAIYYFCRLLNEGNYVLKFQLKGVIFASENIYSEQRIFVESILGCRALAHYGHTERVVFGEEVLGDDPVPKYRFNHLYGYTEIDPVDNCIIGTGFINRKMPLLRYKTDDIAKLSEGYDGCYEIEGHRTAAMVGKNGERTSSASFAHMDSTFDYIDQFQFEQYKPGYIIVYIVPKKSLSDNELEKIKRIFEDKFMHNMEVELRVVKEVMLTTRGKFALLIQHMKD